jgi:CRP/FNR family nitrogen fixation transcriptional regulator
MHGLSVSTPHTDIRPLLRTQPTQPLVRLAEGLELPGVSMPFLRNEEIYGQDEPAEFVYRVLSGTVRTCRQLADGRRQVEAFHLAGDVFGLECGDVHYASAEAVGDCEVALVRRSAVETAARRDGTAARALWLLATGDLERVRRLTLTLARKGATERVASFLLAMSVRGGGDVVDLSMSRNDLADHLGLTIETVSRTFTQLERSRLIELPSPRRVVLRDRRGLEALDG